MDDYLVHYGVLGQKWGIRRYQNKDGSLTEAGKERYAKKGIPEEAHGWINRKTAEGTVKGAAAGVGGTLAAYAVSDTISKAADTLFDAGRRAVMEGAVRANPFNVAGEFISKFANLPVTDLMFDALLDVLPYSVPLKTIELGARILTPVLSGAVGAISMGALSRFKAETKAMGAKAGVENNDKKVQRTYNVNLVRGKS